MKFISLLIDIHSSKISHTRLDPKRILIDFDNNFKLIGLSNKQTKKKDKEIKILELDFEETPNNTFKAPEQLDKK